jgi:hypothetical protein
VFSVAFETILVFDFDACDNRPIKNGAPQGAIFMVRQAWRVARKRNQFGCGGHAGDLEVKVLYTPGKGKC